MLIPATRPLLLALIAAMLAMLATATVVAELHGTVTRVTDGDTVRFAPAGGGSTLSVRLAGIDAPEICQAWGPQAREALQHKTAGRTLRLLVTARDRFGRTIGALHWVHYGLNRRMVAEGHAWSMRRGAYALEQLAAQDSGLGLHTDPLAVQPGEFRRAHGPCRR